MTETTTTRSIEYATFILERVYPTTRERVYAAMANTELKAKWFGAQDGHISWDFNFHEGGREVHSGNMTLPNGEEHHSKFDAYYLEIVENERITWSYNLCADGVKQSSSLTVVELTTAPEGIRLTFTRTGAFFDGHEKPSRREEGSGWILDAFGETLT